MGSWFILNFSPVLEVAGNYYLAVLYKQKTDVACILRS